jgi:DNA-binding Xre family transcriptional regulator
MLTLNLVLFDSFLQLNHKKIQRNELAEETSISEKTLAATGFEPAHP